MPSIPKQFLLVVLPVFLLSACQQGPSKTLKRDVVKNYARIVHASYKDSYQLAVQLNRSVQSFAQAPSRDRFQAAKQAWLSAREPYGQTEVYRFYGGPIDDADGPEPYINAWPMDESYIDYVQERPQSGVINNASTYPAITKTLLLEMNEKEGEKSISTGYHAIEFLLWGQDFYDESAGRRSYTDYVANSQADAPHPKRRADYLQTTSDLLVTHLGALVKAWAPNQSSNYRKTFVNGPPAQAVSNILTGMGSLSGAELAGERMTVPFETKNQEDEHSCFSDNTHRDIVNNIRGVQNVYLGTYKRLDGSVIEGPGVRALVKAVDPALAKEIDAQLTKTLETAQAIPAPFDQAITGIDSDPGRQQVHRTIQALRQLTGLIAEAASKLEVKINLEI